MIFIMTREKLTYIKINKGLKHKTGQTDVEQSKPQSDQI